MIEPPRSAAYRPDVVPIRLAISIACVALVATAAHGQLLSERVDGRQRVCVYRDMVRTYTSGGGSREHRVGLGENCPLMPPNPGSAPLPPTARLTSESIEGRTRQCTYTQAGLVWQITTTIDRPCPLAAGMLPDAPPEQR